MKLTTEQFAEHFNDRLRMLKRSAAAYDQGDYAEATRLAGSIVKLIGDRTTKHGGVNKNFVSLASRLGIKPKEMIDTSLVGVMDQEHLHGPVFILGFHLSDANGLAPILDGFERESLGQQRKTEFEQWWNSPVLRDCRGNEFSRREIVETMRDQEDAHTDGDIDPGYAEVAYNGAIGITQANAREPSFDINPARVAVRQVAHELLRTFVPDLPPHFIQTRELKVQPLVLYEIMECSAAGEFVRVLDHKRMEFKAETTASPEVWSEWQTFIDLGHESAQTQILSDGGRDSDLALRMAIFNFAPYPTEGFQAMVSMQSPSGDTLATSNEQLGVLNTRTNC